MKYKGSKSLPLENATAREILELFYPRHELHSVSEVEDSPGEIDVVCSCGQTLLITERDALAEEVDFKKIRARFERLGKYEKFDIRKIPPPTPKNAKKKL
jgi:hypothetical protein